ncbi:hypothetical protein BCJMU51_0822 [Bacillus cereus]|nr:hypothetical protein BCM0045_0851 [Bacillus cereus]GIX57784.1 hypothetical protein BPADB04_28140 [Bacillus paranthracis]BCB98767.1 hypothetical protein BCM0057_0850 [Bacillus cereus]BCC22260.1 hypothetical protein BCM0079_0853 [Bacillus cereus]BCC33870.1 hypothetical protein BCM0105_0860 [Bacillus cereus]
MVWNFLFVGKARKVRQRIKKHFEDNVSPIKNHRDEVYRIDVCIVRKSDGKRNLRNIYD